MRALSKKLLRDLLQLKGQVITTALVVAAGVAIYLGFQSTYGSLLASRDIYYERYRFPDLFVSLERAPEALLRRLEAIEGVGTLEARITQMVRVTLPDAKQPPVARLIGLPDHQRPALADLHLVSGRWPEPGRDGEALLLASFATRFGIRSGDRLAVIMEGQERRLTIVGTALSPEYVYPAGSGGEVIPDDERFTVLWMLRAQVAPIFQMEGAFNDLLVRVQPGFDSKKVAAALDRALGPYGGLGTVLARDQPSNQILNGELSQLESMATALPLVFLAVAAFLLNVVLSRLIYLQRAQIATLKAVGYSDFEVGRHFLALVSCVVLLGAVLGLAAGLWFGQALHGMYGEFFRFPVQRYSLDPQLIAVAFLVSLLAGATGAIFSVVGVVRLPPAEAMRPAPPLSYRRSFLERLGLLNWAPQSLRMIVRELTRRPLRTVLSVLGVAMATGTCILGRFNYDAVQGLERLMFVDSMREDLTVTFTRPVPLRAVRALGKLPGVLVAEPLRVVPVRISAHGQARDIALIAYSANQLRRPTGESGLGRPLPAGGVMLTNILADVLGVRVGDPVTVEVREGRRGHHTLTVTGLVDELAGLQGHLDATVLEAMLGEAPTASLALLQVDSNLVASVTERLLQAPQILGVANKNATWERFRAQSGASITMMTFFATIFGIIIAVGVVYNNARVALSMRERDLASLRVLGFTRGEISTILLGELAIQVLLALPLGFWLGYQMCVAVAQTIEPERFRLPLLISMQTYAFAATITLVAAAFSALLVRRKLDHLDLIGVLKTRE